MQAYSEGFAKVYNLRWGGFARQVAPHIREFYESRPGGNDSRAMLDLCCGTGQLAAIFLEAGYRVTGIDSSGPMLAHARENTAAYAAAGRARFVQADASRFKLRQRFGLIVSTFDALNHLENLEALEACFRCVFAVLEEGGVFVFDLNTRLGLRRWNTISIDDSDELTIINRGLYDGSGDKAWTRITGFYPAENGLYRRFEETAYNTCFDLAEVKAALLQAGWREPYFARLQALAVPLEKLEEEGRIYVVAGK